MERTLILIKPDAYHRGLIGKIISRFEEKGLQLIAAKLIIPSDNILDKQYEHLKDKPFFSEIKEFMKSAPVLATVWKGKNCIEVVRKLLGVTNSREASPGTIRGDFSMSVMCNLVHASDSKENAEKEIKLYFKEEEIIDWKRKDIKFFYSEREI